MKNIIALFILIVPMITFSQSSGLSMFDNLVGKTWKAEGNWGDGSKFSQEIEINYSLDSSIVKLNTIGFVDKAQIKLGLRNHGIRQFDETSNSVKFWEFDVFGGLTEGTVISEGKNIVYQYKYGNSNLTDMWEYIDDSTYTYKVGEYNNGIWNKVYLNTQFKERTIPDIEGMYLEMKNNLIGNWKSPAWSGQLNESWSLDKNGHLIQDAQYIENQKVMYEASNKIEIENDEIILFTIIKGSNPKIFKAYSYSKNSITFKNSDYKNPNVVVYTFLSKNEFHRKISGIENDNSTSYTFKFKR